MGLICTYPIANVVPTTRKMNVFSLGRPSCSLKIERICLHTLQNVFQALQRKVVQCYGLLEKSEGFWLLKVTFLTFFTEVGGKSGYKLKL